MARSTRVSSRADDAYEFEQKETTILPDHQPDPGPARVEAETLAGTAHSVLKATMPALRSAVPDAPSMNQRNAKAGTSGPLRVAWLLQKQDIASASARYRAFHMAMALGAYDTTHSFFTDPAQLTRSLKPIDAIVIVKRLDTDIQNLVAVARDMRRAIFLDLCDDMLGASYRRTSSSLNRMTFAAILPCLDGIVVPTQAMARHLLSYCRQAVVAQPRVFVVPDVAETPELMLAAQRFASSAKIGEPQRPIPFSAHGLPRQTPRPKVPSIANPMRVVWFGNFGAPHSNFGIASLMSAEQALRDVNRDIPLELVIISNSRERFDGAIASADFPTRYVQWTETTVYDEILRADVALLTNGDDHYSKLKSANRILLALALGIPVIANSNQATEQVRPAIVIDDYEGGLRRFLGPDRERACREAREAARQLLPRFDLSSVGRRWFRILSSTCAAGQRAAKAAKPAPLFVMENGVRLESLAKAMEDYRQRGVKPMVTLTPAAAQGARLRDLLRDAHIIANIVLPQDLKSEDARWLRGCTELILETASGAVTDTLQAWAKGRKVPVRPLEAPDPAPNPAPLSVPVAPPRLQEHPAASNAEDWLFVVPKEAKGWILDAICREIGTRHKGPWTTVYNPKQLPRAQNIFFAHYWNYLDHLKRSPQIRESNTFVWYTHPREIPYSEAEQLAGYSAATQMIFTCAAFRDDWYARGLPRERGRVVLGGADEHLFVGHARGSGVVGLSSSFYERKNPDLLLSIVSAMPHRRFHLVGRKWEQYSRFGELMALQNFSYETADYVAYPKIYSQFDVFLSLAVLEGGPIPLLEAMMVNAVPVASLTGFAPDLIRHGENGFLFPVGADAATIVPLIDQAFAIKTDVRSTVLDYTWDKFAATILALGR